MKYHIQYVLITITHKWHVFRECCRLGIVWRGITHDLSKFTLAEWIPRVRAMRNRTLLGEDGLVDVSKADDELALCWLQHYRRNSHHWQYWVAYLDNGNVRALNMPEADRKEMLADWLAVSRRPDRMDMLPWYEQNRGNFLLHPATRTWLEKQLKIKS